MTDPEIRVNPWTKESVIIAPLRAERPHQFEPRDMSSGQNVDPDCPFCLGNEHHTPATLLALNATGNQTAGNDWIVRVVPNKFPAVIQKPEREKPDVANSAATRAFGSHEVVIESPRHIGTAAELATENMEIVLAAMSTRMKALYSDPKIKHVQVFKNCGEAAGASIFHAHSQIIGLPVLPRVVEHAIAEEVQFRKERKARLWDNVADQLNDHIVSVGESLIAFCPPFSRHPFEVWIGPKTEISASWSSPEVRQELAASICRWTQRIEGLAGGTAWNWLLVNTTSHAAGHWHIEIFPRLTSQAGFEWATGVHINPIAPATAAAELRK